MANKKISQLPSGALQLSTIFPIVANGITSQTTFNSLLTEIHNRAIFATGGTYNIVDGITTLTLNTGESFDVTGFFTGFTYTPENTANKQNSLVVDGSGFKYPTVDTINELANSITKASINTGFIDSNDLFVMTRVDNSTLTLSATSRGIIFKTLLGTLPYVPATAILQIPDTTINLASIPLSALSISSDGIYVRFIGFTDTGTIMYSDTNFKGSLSTAQLGILVLNVTGGTANFLDSTRNVINVPSIANYSNLELLMLGLQSDVNIHPNPSAMTVNNTSGSLKGISVNWHGANNDKKLIASNPISSFTHLSQANALTTIPPSFTTNVTTGLYWNGSSLVSLSTSGAASIQRWLVTINGTLALQYGEAEYVNLDTAKNNISTATFLDILPVETYVEISRMAAIRDTTDLSDTTQAVFRVSAGGGSVSTNATVWGTINGNINNQTDLFNTFVPLRDKHFVNLGTATTGTTNITLSAGTNFKLFVTGDTNLNFIPYIDGAESNLIVKLPIVTNSSVQFSPNVKINGNSISLIKNLDGSRDILFNSGGAGFNSTVVDIVQQPDGKILVGGNFSSYNGLPSNSIARINIDGSRDTTFNVGGLGFAGGGVNNILVQSDNKIVVGGGFTSYNGITISRLVRLNSDGSPDNTFITNIGTGFNASVYTILEQSGTSKLIIAGQFTSYKDTGRNGIVRLNTDGTLDTSFNFSGSGLVVNGDYVNFACKQLDEKIIIGGSINSYNGIPLHNLARLDSEGFIDVSFSGNINDNNIPTIIQQLDGKILVGGASVSRGNSFYTNRIVKLNSNGAPDISFNIGGGFIFNGSVLTVSVQPDGKVIGGGDFQTYSGQAQNRLIRLNTGGTRDTSFNIGTGFNNTINTIFLQNNNKIVVGGQFSQYSGININAITRLNNDGIIDSSFGNLFLNTSSIVNVLLEQSNDNKILVGGVFTTFNNPSQPFISKLNTSGGFDVLFNVGTGFNASAKIIIETSGDSKLLVGGDFTSYSGVQQNRLIKLNLEGRRDTSFNIGTGFNNSVNYIMQQSDGQLLVGGDFTSYSGVQQNRIIRLNLDGTRDTSLNIGTGFNNSVTAITQQLDSKLVIGGNFTQYSGITTGVTRFIRINTDGSRDTSLNIGTGFNNSVNTIIVQTGDSKILVGGQFTTYSGQIQNYITRLNTGGTIDINFSAGTGFDNQVKIMKLQPDNKILVGGQFSKYSTIPINRIVKLNNDGSLDTTFSGTVGGISAPVLCIIQQSGDSKTLVSGQFVTQGALMRLNTDGNKDTTFSGLTTGFNSFVYKFHLQPDNKIIALGAFTTFNGGATRPYHTRLNTNGSIDNTYYTGTGFNNFINSSAQQLDGKILVTGAFTTFSGSPTPGFARLNTDGTKDITFNVGTGFTSGSSFTSILQQSDSKILVGGTFTQYSGISLNNFIRLNSDGTPDNTFNIGTGFNNTIQFVIQQPDSKILVGGSFNRYYSGITANRIIRLNLDGTPDNTFSGVTTGFDGTVQIIRLETNGTILVGGAFNSFNNILATKIIRLNSDGSYDNTFNSGTGGFNSTPLCFIQESGTSVFVGGGFTQYSGSLTNRIARLNTNGTYDTSFSGNGVYNITTFNNIINAINLTNDNKIIIEGDFTLNISGLSYSRIAKLDINGNVDLTFTPSVNYNNMVNNSIITSDNKLISVGSFTSSTGGTSQNLMRLSSDGIVDSLFKVGTGFNNTVTVITQQPDNKIVVGGIFTLYSGLTANTIVRLNTDGSYDSSFSGGNQINFGVGFNNNLLAMITQNDGKIVIGGSFTSYNGIPANRIIRLTTGGTIDGTFSAGTGFNNSVNSLRLESDDKILVIGNFSSYNGLVAGGIIRLNSDGSKDTTYSSTTIGFDSVASNVSKQSGSTFACGNFNSYGGIRSNGLIRYYLDGSVDTTFNSGGTGAGGINCITQLPDEKLMLSVSSTIYNGVTVNYLTRVNLDGSIDPSFVNGANNAVFPTFVQSDGKLLLGGIFTSYNGVSQGDFTRLNAPSGNTLYYKILQYGSNIIIK